MDETYIDAETDTNALSVRSTAGLLTFRTTSGASVMLDRVAVSGLISAAAIWLGGDE